MKVLQLRYSLDEFMGKHQVRNKRQTRFKRRKSPRHNESLLGYHAAIADPCLKKRQLPCFSDRTSEVVRVQLICGSRVLGLSTCARTDETAPRGTDAQGLREHFFVLRAWYLNECSAVAIHRVHKASAELSSQSISAGRYSDAGAQIPKATRSGPFLRRQENDRHRSDSRRYRERHTG